MNQKLSNTVWLRVISFLEMPPGGMLRENIEHQHARFLSFLVLFTHLFSTIQRTKPIKNLFNIGKKYALYTLHCTVHTILFGEFILTCLLDGVLAAHQLLESSSYSSARVSGSLYIHSFIHLNFSFINLIAILLIYPFIH